MPVPTWHFQSVLPAGGIISSVSDMLKYLRCNMGQGPLARVCLFAQRPRAQGELGHQIGLVWNINSKTGVIGHNGDTLGFHADFAISRDRQNGRGRAQQRPAVDRHRRARAGAELSDRRVPVVGAGVGNRSQILRRRVLQRERRLRVSGREPRGSRTS